jgi:hypothetical protein
VVRIPDRNTGGKQDNQQQTETDEASWPAGARRPI